MTVDNPSSRLVSLDVFRGLTVAGMILVTDPGTYDAVYPQLLHAPWHGATATDMIFPSFLFIVGVAITLSLSSRIDHGDNRGRLALHAIRRSLTILALGLLVNAFSDYHWHTLRLPGVLQRIAVCYLCGALLYLATHTHPYARRVLILVSLCVGFLGAYWIMLKVVPVPGFGAGHLDSYGSLPAYIDRAVFGIHHLWAYGVTPGVGVTYDPEGILSTLPAISTVLIGILAGEWMKTSHTGFTKFFILAAAGCCLLANGLLLHPFLPVNKRLWTSSFVLFAGGVSLLLFSISYAMVDLRRSRWWTPPALVFGTNAIFAFALSNILTTLTDRIEMVGASGPESLHEWANQHLFASWLSPVHGSLAYACSVVLLHLAILYPLYRKRIFLRV